jgi:hypothetical protein
MFAGRHRGLPDAVDNAISLPKQMEVLGHLQVEEQKITTDRRHQSLVITCHPFLMQCLWLTIFFRNSLCDISEIMFMLME